MYIFREIRVIYLCSVWFLSKCETRIQKNWFFNLINRELNICIWEIGVIFLCFFRLLRKHGKIIENIFVLEEEFHKFFVKNCYKMPTYLEHFFSYVDIQFS